MEQPSHLTGIPATPLTPRDALTTAQVLRRFWISDHAWVRALIPNFYKVDDTLYRSAHPSPRTLKRAARAGVRTVLSLRGGGDSIPNIIERAACAALGLELRYLAIRAVELPSAEALLVLISHLRTAPKPLLIHCKSGADRTGLAVTLYRHIELGEPLETARQALSWRYGHLARGRAGVVHRMLDSYAEARSQTGISFEDWVQTGYDPEALMAART